jgi:hypothetical protein
MSMKEKTIKFLKYTLIFRSFPPSKNWCVAIVTPSGSDVYYYKPNQTRFKELERCVKHFVKNRYPEESQAAFELRDILQKRNQLKQLRRRREEANKNKQPSNEILYR